MSVIHHKHGARPCRGDISARQSRRRKATRRALRIPALRLVLLSIQTGDTWITVYRGKCNGQPVALDHERTDGVTDQAE